MGSYKEKKQYSKIISNQPCSRSSTSDFFCNILDVYFKYCTILKSQNFTIFKKSMTIIITFQVKILPNVRVKGSKYNFLSRNQGHKELINNKVFITFRLFPGKTLKIQ